MIKFLLNTAVLIIVTFSTYGQNTLSQMSQMRVKTNQSGMIVLGAWAVGNIFVSANKFDRKSENQHFYRMNMYWNIANLGIAASGYLNSVGGSFEHLTDEEKLRKQHKIEKLLLINMGLNVSYMLGGVYLMERAENREVRPNRLKIRGYGKSLIVQGGFLLALDALLYLKHTSNRKRYGKYQIVPAMTQNGAGLIFRLR